MKKGIIFDADGTLLNTERLFMRAWKDAGVEYGYQIPYDALVATRSLALEMAQKVFCSACGEDFPFEQAYLRHHEIAESFIAATPAAELRMPRVLTTLTQLQERGFQLAVASMTRRERNIRHLEQAELLPFFPLVVGGDMVEHGKPAPDIFLLAAQKLGLSPEECLVVGDSPSDMFAAHAANIQAILIPDKAPANPQTIAMSLAVLSDFSELADLPECSGNER